jgi:hypothetical protein
MPPALSAHARRLAVVLEMLALLALVSGAFPLAVSSPIWWLRLGDSEAGVFGRRVHFSRRAATAVAPELPLPLGLGNPAAAHLAFM